MHDLDAKRLLFATPGKDHTTLESFAVDLEAHGGKRTAIAHACIDMRMHWLQRANLKSARGWRLKMGLREVFARARSHNDAVQAAADLDRWISWARRSRLESFKRLGATLREHFDAVVRGMLDHRSNAFVEAMNGLMQQAKRAARGFRTAANFIAIAFLRLGKLTHLPVSPFVPAMPHPSRAMTH